MDMDIIDLESTLYAYAFYFNKNMSDTLSRETRGRGFLKSINTKNVSSVDDFQYFHFQTKMDFYFKSEFLI
jgi:hypothetical protein